jgi:hypothetical protein
MRFILLSLLLTLAATNLAAGHASPIEDVNFGAEAAWNRTDGVLQLNSFLFSDHLSYELVHEWAASNRHQLSYTVPMYGGNEAAGLGDSALNYRYQIAGSPDSPFAAAARLSLILPTRSEQWGERSTGLQVNIPLSATLGSRVVSHTNVGATWFRERDVQELNLAQSFSLSLTDRLAFALDAAFTHTVGDEALFVVRPGIQYSFEVPGGMTITPGLAVPLDHSGVLFNIAIERKLWE